MRACPECGSVNPVQITRCLVCDDPLPKEIEDLIDGRYRTLKELGRGANGVVFAAFDVALRRQVALKFLAPQLVKKPRAVKRFQREASALASIRSDHVAQVFSFGIEKGAMFFAMELVLGRSCKKIIEQQTANDEWIPVHRALVILIEMSRGLSAVHSAGIVHRDVKPDNIFLRDELAGIDSVKLIDFSVSKFVEEATRVSVDGEVLGTAAYLAPEQAMGQRNLDHRIDIWAVGIVLYEMLVGEPPFLEDNLIDTVTAILHREVPPSPGCGPRSTPPWTR